MNPTTASKSIAEEQIVPSDYRSEQTFEELRISAEIKRAIAEKGYLLPTPVQSVVLEPILQGKDLIVRSKTGTGKTAAFGIPILERIATGTNEVRAIVLCPTRELAIQVAEEIQSLGKYKGSKVVAIYGGGSMPQQVEALRQGGEIVVGTPGRVYDHIRRGTLKLDHAQIAVLDEADEMLSMGFFEEVTRILDALPDERQTLLFSATVPQDIQQIIESYLHEPQTILLSGDVFTVEGIQNIIYYTVDSYPKPRNLLYLVEREEPDAAIIFCNTRDDTSLITAVLNRNGYDAEYLNGDLPQKERERVMNKIKAGEVRFMVATDIAARGIDISDLSHVINYSLPEDPAVYLHRIGRTGRIGKDGVAISLISGRELVTLTALEKRYGIKFEERKLPTPEDAKQLWIDRHVAQLAEGSQGSVFEAFLPLAQALREKPGSDALMAFALKYFFHHHQMEIAAQRAAANARAMSIERPAREPRSHEPAREPPPREARPRREGREEPKKRPPAEPRLEGHSAAEPRRAEAASNPNETRVYVNWGDLDPLPPEDLVGALVGATQLDANQLRGGLSVDGRRGFLSLPTAQAEKVLALNGQELSGKKLRAEVARVAPSKRRRR